MHDRCENPFNVEICMKPGVSDLLLHIQNEILEAVTSGDTLRDIADLLCRRIENSSSNHRMFSAYSRPGPKASPAGRAKPA